MKNRITALRAEQDQRPGTETPSDRPVPGSPPDRGVPRDTSRAYLAGAAAFSLDALTGHEAEAEDV